MPFIESYFEDYRDFFIENALVFEPHNDIVNKWLIGKYNILLGFYSVLDLDRKFHYYLSAKYDEDNEIREIVKSKPHIPIIDKDWENAKRENIFKILRKLFEKESTLKSGKLTPKFYQHYNHKDDNLIHRLYANTLVQIDRAQKNDISQYEVQVVLAEEILFFIAFNNFELYGSQLAADLKEVFEKEISVNGSEKYIRFNFHQLVKYTASVEAKITPDNPKLNDYFVIKNKSETFFDHKSWGTNNEGSFRGVIDKAIQLSSEEERAEIFDLVWDFMNTFKDHIKNQNVISNLNLSETETLAEVLSRFDIASVRDIWLELDESNKCMWDILIFPMYKSFRYKDISIKTFCFQEEITVNNPVLFHAFVKPVYQITKGEQVDESVETLFGFHLTKEVCRHYSKSLIENVFVGQTIQHSLLKPQINNFISKIISKNLSHTDGSHVMVDFENNVDEKNFDVEQFKLYNQHLRNTMELVADISGKLGMQSYYEYELLPFLIDLNNNYFSSFRESKTELHSKFLGSGLNDGEAQSIISFDAKKSKDALFPGGENGKTAFLSIVKNIFRNLKKHSSKSVHTIDGKNVDYYELEISIDDADNELRDDYHKVTITELSYKYKNEKINNDYKAAIERVDSINQHLIKDEIIQPNGKVKMDGWGLLEIRICAAYLIGLPLDEYNHSITDFSYMDIATGRLFPTEFVYADKVDIGEGDYRIRHIFYLRKPKFATIWLKENQEISVYQKQKLIENAFVIKNKNKHKHNYNSSTEFVIGSHDYEDTGKHHNFKVITCKECFNIETLKPDKLKSLVLEKWTKHLSDKVKAIIKTTENDKKLLYYLTKETVEDTEQIVPLELAILDDHLKHFRKVYSTQGNNKDKTLEYFKNFAYYEPTSSENESEVAFQDTNTSQKIETIETKVAIWDERLGKYLKNTQQKDAPNGFNKAEIYGLKGVYTPKQDLKEYFYYEAKDDSKKQTIKTLRHLKVDLKEEFKQCDYVVLHFSGFENIVGRSKAEDGQSYTLESAYQELLDCLKIKSTSKYLIFTSGKGIPTTLPNRSYFLPFTTLEGLVKSKPKFNLICTLNSLRLINTKLNEK